MPVPVPPPLPDPPTRSYVDVHLETLSCVPLRAEMTINGVTFVAGLYFRPHCPVPDPGDADCYDPPAGHAKCVAACEHLVEWKHDNGGTTDMHVFQLRVDDDGTHPDALPAKVHLRLTTLADGAVWEGDQTELLDTLADHRAGFYHSGVMEFVLDEPVLRALGKNCIPYNPP
jgi:hypothetical protein